MHGVPVLAIGEGEKTKKTKASMGFGFERHKDTHTAPSENLSNDEEQIIQSKRKCGHDGLTRIHTPL